MPRLSSLLLALALLPGCETASRVGSGLLGAGPVGAAGQPGFVRGFLGGVAAEEPVAAAIARDVLSGGGNAADAVVAAGFAMSVTLPSRAGLGGGGACVVFDRRRGEAEAVLFPPGARQGFPANADRPAALPLMARGLFALHTRLPGGRPIEELIAPAEQLARFGAPMSRALATDLAAVHGPLFADPNARAVFADAQGRPVAVGDRFANPSLAATLAALRVQGVGDLHVGQLARRLEESAALAGGGAMALSELRPALPRVVRVIAVDLPGGVRAGFAPTPGGAAAASALRQLQATGRLDAAQARAQAVLAAAPRGADGTPDLAALVNAPLEGASPRAWPASAGVVAFDRDGNAASCAFTLNNLFGTGRVAPGLGFLLAAAPGFGPVETPPLAAAIAYAPVTRAFRSAGAASGQGDAPVSLAAAIGAEALRNALPSDAAASAAPAAPQGRVQFAACPRFLPGAAELCSAASDPRGAGVALGATER